MNNQNTSSKFFQRLDMAIHKLTKIMALFSGALFLGLAFYMTIDVVSRKLGGPFTGVADEVASYILACSGTWALAYALADGSHVRIDVLLHLFPERVQKFLYFWALLLAAGFASLLAWKMWAVTIESMRIGALPSGSLLALPLVYPQGLASIGLTTLVLQAILMAYKVLVEFCSQIKQESLGDTASGVAEATSPLASND